MNDVAVITGYIMYYRLLEDKLNGSFFTQIDKAIEIAEAFCKLYPPDFEWGVEIDFEETLEKFLTKSLHN